MSPTLVHFRSVPYTAIGFFQTPLSPVTPLLTACLPVSWVTGFLSTHLLGNMPRIPRSPSCGKGQIYDGTFTKTLAEGHGVAAEMLLAHGIEVYTEEDLGGLK